MIIKLAENLKMLRKDNKLSQEKLAELLGVTPQSVSKWELGLSCPDIQLLPSIANVFKVSTDELLGIKQISSVNSVYLQMQSLIDEAKTLEEKHELAYKFALLATTCEWEREKQSADKVIRGNEYKDFAFGMHQGGITCKGYNSVFITSFKDYPEFDKNTIRKIHKYLSSINKINTLEVLFAMYRMNLKYGLKSYSMEDIVKNTGIEENKLWLAFNDLNINVEYDSRGNEKWNLSCLNDVPMLMTLLIPYITNIDSGMNLRK